MKDTINKFQRGIIKAFGIDIYLREWENNKKLTGASLFDKDEYEYLENKLWFEGRSNKLEEFYKTKIPHTIRNNSNNFWRAVNTDMPKAHYPLPSLISKSMGTLLFNQYPNIVVDAGSEARNKVLQSRLDSIADTNDIYVFLQNAAAIQSYSGCVGLKVNFDPTLSDDPLITAYPKEQIKVEKKYGQIIYIDFIDYLENDLKLISRYGLGYINYMLFDKDKRRIDPSTMGLEDIAFFDKDGNIIPVMFATIVNNKGNQSESDYSGLIDTFQLIDETYSSLNNYIRKTKPKTYITEDLVPKDAAGRVLRRNDFDDTIVILDRVVGEDSSKIERDIVKLEVDGYMNVLSQLRDIALQKIGLSPATIGIDAAGANASGEALNIRERASGRLREEKLSNWSEQLDKFFYGILMFDYLLKQSIEASKGIYVVELPHEFQVKCNFGDFVKENLKERSTVYMNLYEKGLISLEFAIERIFGDQLSAEQLTTLIEQTKNQKGNV